MHPISIKSIVYRHLGAQTLMKSIFLISCNFIFARTLRIILYFSLITRISALLWKITLITPIFKSDDSTDGKSYWPIYIVDTIFKLFENLIVHNTILMCSEQYGFMPTQYNIPLLIPNSLSFIILCQLILSLVIR